MKQFITLSLFNSFKNSLTHSLIHSPINSKHKLIHSQTHSRIHSFTYSFSHSFTHSHTDSLTHSLIGSLTRSLTHYSLNQHHRLVSMILLTFTTTFLGFWIVQGIFLQPILASWLERPTFPFSPFPLQQ